MTDNVFLAPCEFGNFEKTVLSAVELPEDSNHPEEFGDRESVRFWGAREGTQNRSHFENMTPGDLVIFYQSGSYVGVGRVGTTFEDTEGWASETFWDQAPSNLLYTVEDFSPVSVPRSAVNRIFDYGPDYSPQGLMRVASTRVSERPAVIKRAIEKYSEQRA